MAPTHMQILGNAVPNGIRAAVLACACAMLMTVQGASTAASESSVGSAGEIPVDWAPRVAASQMLFSPTSPGDGFAPSIGNGFLSGDVGCCSGTPALLCDERSSCGSVYLAGVFNMPPKSIFVEPHRAAVPSPHSVYVTDVSAAAAREGEGVTLVGAALDLEQGIVFNRTTLGSSAGAGCAGATLTQAHFAHRSMRNVAVLAFSLDLSGAADANTSTTCSVALSACTRPATTDFNIISGTATILRRDPDAQGVTSPQTAHLVVKGVFPPPPGAALPPPPLTAVGLAYEPVPATLTLSAATPQARFLAAYSSSLEPGVSNASVVSSASSHLAAAQAQTTAALTASHTAAWAEVWEGGIEMAGNITISASVNSSMYYILSAVRADFAHGVSPGGLARDSYNGHSFWDCETWMFPNTVALFPSIADSLMQYRFALLPAARDRARLHNLTDASKGGEQDAAMWPWESALTGYGVSAWHTGDENEVHITGDIPMAMRLHYRASGNDTWLSSAWPSIRDSADFFVARSTAVHPSDPSGNWTLLDVVPPDESAGVINSSAYTNAIAAETMRFATAAAARLGQPANPKWASMAPRAYLPVVDCDGQGLMCHPEFDGYHGQPINQADVALLQYPLGIPMDHGVAVNDLEYYQARSSGPTTAGFYTGDSAYSIAWLGLGNRSAADDQFQLAFEHMDIGHYNVWMEKSFGDKGHLNFITGAGGYVQNMLYGYAGLRYSGLVDGEGSESVNGGDAGAMVVMPVLPPGGVTRVVLRAVTFRGSRLSVTYDDSSIAVELLRSVPGAPKLGAMAGGGAVDNVTPLEQGKPVSFPSGSISVVPM